MANNDSKKYKLGMIGLGTMGRNLLLNMADKGFSVTGYDKDQKMIAKLEDEGKNHNLEGFDNIENFIDSLQTPRTLILLVPAGPIVDSVIAELKPLLSKGDIIIDSGNSHFSDTNRRVAELENDGLHFFGMGISGGEEGARFGPSMMPGGDKNAYNVMKDIFEAIAAKVNNDPCVTYIGPGASGHFVKMVHNGIEYAIMQLLAETYGILKNGLGYSNQEIHNVFKKWNEGRLQSFLLEITTDIFPVKDTETPNDLLDMIKDEARSKGTGKWTSEVSMELQLPVPTINEAVTNRDLSKYKALRVSLEEAFGKKDSKIDISIDDLENAFYFSMISAYAQGLHLLVQASKEYKYELKLNQIAKIWRGGCIIRAKFLEDIYQAYDKNNSLEHLFGDAGIQKIIKSTLAGTRKTVAACVSSGIGIPAFASTLTYFDTITSARMPSNLIQAQRDFFGAHTFERIDKEGVFHAKWN
ncbi:NADP-dependent phosphogluconate dehydrogenase [Flavobacterium bizetiae]|uniref:6-phosphogluconate dehydrogenase, decarboxylating n=1 Tax=Flavobacterium bizetiae TaxID=2704140 RepID=A0A6J4GLC5_9FLAO|nr:NADP-dependent phosphogluconate dehydrogenase [Flavobacterium bizetiae]CAA9198300.1 6-phosphogluconate dehydrogenase, NADP(+)-dependent, decarboxylating [Flavobacterium bizetiae]CAD5343519.1 6-phosphogluconate dehydrogenase, NADP(+)-dependent, decarboxylating [Flavobacterium bizetiae]CAD5349513.1 6-phosphogluconate dehydrogenase, NADP(+)-dependent, decarboxylating [Flavobacterium bizetiae]